MVRADRNVVAQLAVLVLVTGPLDLVIDPVQRVARDRGEADLDPFVRAVRAEPGAADSDPAVDVSVTDGRRR
jgi:hypothetical protein